MVRISLAAASCFTLISPRITFLLPFLSLEELEWMRWRKRERGRKLHHRNVLPFFFFTHQPPF